MSKTVVEYITTVEALKALKDCNDKIFREGYSHNSYLKFLNGVLCDFNDTDEVVDFNVSVQLSSKKGDRLYHYVEEPLKLQSGKLYMTRDGRQAYVCYNDWQDTFYGCIRNWSQIIKWNADGSVQDANPHNIDIVSEWDD